MSAAPAARNDDDDEGDADVPTAFLCPILQDVMRDPVCTVRAPSGQCAMAGMRRARACETTHTTHLALTCALAAACVRAQVDGARMRAPGVAHAHTRISVSVATFCDATFAADVIVCVRARLHSFPLSPFFPRAQGTRTSAAPSRTGCASAPRAR
jgi:hypothetical protein